MEFLIKMEEHVGNVLKAMDCHLAHWSDKALLGALSVLYLIWRVLTLPVFEFGGDAAWKWRILRYFYATGEWFPQIADHHQGRWAQNLPVYWTMKLLQNDAGWVAAVIPILTGLGTLLVVYLLIRRMAGKTAALCGTLMCMGLPVFVQESVQFLPSLPATFYTLCSLLLLMIYLHRPAWYLPVGAGLVLGLAWGARVTAVYWGIGMGLFFLFYPVPGKSLFTVKRFHLNSAAVLFGAAFLAVLLCETWLLNSHFGVDAGRISMLKAHTGENLDRNGVGLIAYLLSPFAYLLDLTGKFRISAPRVLLMLMTIPVVIAVWRTKEATPERKFLAFTITVAAFFHCYMVVSVFPFKHPERPLDRYLLTLMIASVILLVTSWPLLLDKCGKYRMWVRRSGFAGFAVLGVFLVAALFNDAVGGDHLFAKCRVYRCMNAVREENMPALVRYHRGKDFTSRTQKLIILWRSLFAPPEELPKLESALLGSWSEAWEKETPVITASGEKYYHLSGRRPAPGETCECVEMDELTVRRKKMTFAANGEITGNEKSL